MRCLYSAFCALAVAAVTAVSVAAPVSAQVPGRPSADAPLSLDPYVLRPIRPRGVLEAVAPGVRPVWRGLRVGLRRDCPPLVGADYGIAESGRFTPRVAPDGGVAGRDPLSCSYPVLSEEPAPAFRFVSPEEAHSRGLCARSADERRLFAVDSGNVPPGRPAAFYSAAREGSPYVWLPPANACWYVESRIRVHRRWGLAVPEDEVRVFDAVLAGCPPALRAAPACGGSQPIPR